MGHRRSRSDRRSTSRLTRSCVGRAATAVALALIALVAPAASFGFGRAAPAPQLPSLSISDGTMVGDGEQIQFTVTLTGATEPTTTLPGTITTQPAVDLPATGSSVVSMVLVATALIVAGLAAFFLRRVISPPLLILVLVCAAACAAAAFGASVAHAQQTQPVATVNFHTEDGTATAPQDYTSTSGTINFGPGQTTANIVVAVNATADDSGKTFFVVLTDPVGATIATAVGMATITVKAPATSTTEAATTTTSEAATTSTGATTTTSSTTSTTTATPVNEAPTASNESYLISEDSPLNVAAPGVLGNDTDPDGDLLTAALVSALSNGALTLNADGSFNYTAQPNFNGSDSFTYRASDGALSSNSATVTITVIAVNDAATAAPESYPTFEDTALNVAAPGVLGNDTDPDGDPLLTLLVLGPSDATSFVLNPDGSFTYTPAPNFNGSESFIYRASDGALSSNSATVTITVTAVNDAPTAAPESYPTFEDTSLNVAAPGVLGNDTDPDGNPLTAALVSAPSNGTLTLNTDGSFTYAPALDFSGSDSFTYRAIDGALGSNAATVWIDVTEVP